MWAGRPMMVLLESAYARAGGVLEQGDLTPSEHTESHPKIIKTKHDGRPHEADGLRAGRAS